MQRIHRRLVGRHGELGQFSGVIASCQEVGSGIALYVRGEAGIGKTRLVEEFQRIASSQHFACHVGLVLDFGVGKGQDGIRAIVRSGLECSGQGETAARAAAERVLSDELLDPDQLVHLEIICWTCRSQRSYGRCMTPWIIRRATAGNARPWRSCSVGSAPAGRR